MKTGNINAAITLKSRETLGAVLFETVNFTKYRYNLR